MMEICLFSRWLTACFLEICKRTWFHGQISNPSEEEIRLLVVFCLFAFFAHDSITRSFTFTCIGNCVQLSFAGVRTSKLWQSTDHRPVISWRSPSKPYESVCSEGGRLHHECETQVGRFVVTSERIDRRIDGSRSGNENLINIDHFQTLFYWDVEQK